MRLNDERPAIETSGELEEQFFSIQDQGMIFEILRNKMYSNPILAICREISCNARDAHREVGTPERPIEIHLPNTLEPFYKIKDFGPGISPDRMSNIFIKYTASTKRDDNIQTGGFGLGAKTPFSYSDTFTIITNFDGIQYNYACFIDETKVGKLILLSSTPTSESNGTEIIIPVKMPDFRHFAEFTEVATRHWDVKPIIKGGNIDYIELKKLIEGNGWAVAMYPNSWNRELKLIIDGIEYPVDLSVLRTYLNSKMIDYSRGNIYLYFGVGELSLSANREQVYLDKMTQEKICNRLEDMEIEIKDLITAKIETFSNFWEANVYFRKELSNAFGSIQFLGKLYWHGLPLYDSAAVQLNCDVFIFTKGKYSRRYVTDPNKISRQRSHSLHFDENSMLFINDLTLKQPTVHHIKRAFDVNHDLKSIHVICPNDKVTEDILNEKFNLASMKPHRLSEITKSSARAYVPATSRLLVFKLDVNTTTFKHVSYSSIDDDTNEKVLCKLNKDNYTGNRFATLKTGKTLSQTAFQTIIKSFPKFSFYGIDSETPKERVESDFSDFIHFDDFIKDYVLANSTINFVEIKLAKKHLYDIDDKMLGHIDDFSLLVKKTDSIFMKRLNLHDKIRKLCEDYYGITELIEIYEAMNGVIYDSDLDLFLKDHPEYDIEDINEKYNNKYPLLRYLSMYRYIEAIDYIADYVNCMDTK